MKTSDIHIRDPYILPLPDEGRYLLFGTTGKNAWHSLHNRWSAPPSSPDRGFHNSRTPGPARTRGYAVSDGGSILGPWRQSVHVRRAGTAAWTDLFVHRVQVGMMGQTPHESSMALFDFEGSVEVRVLYRAGKVRAFDIRPLSYGIQAKLDRNTLTFTVRQVPEAPRKIVVRINDDWYTGVLHLLTNPPERDAPRLTDAHVYAVEPGEPAPAELPAGKTVYYFKPGLHELSRGLWLEVDLGGVQMIDRVQLEQGALSMSKRYWR